MGMVINHDPVGTHRAAALSDCAVDHHLAVDARSVGFHDKLGSFERDIIGRLDHHGFNTPDVPAPGGGFVLKPAPVRVLRHATVHGIRWRCKLADIRRAGFYLQHTGVQSLCG